MLDKKILLRALWDYPGQDANELCFKKDDVIELVQKANDDWWEGHVNGKSGLFPANRVQIMSAQQEAQPPAIPARPSLAKAKLSDSSQRLMSDAYLDKASEDTKPNLTAPKPAVPARPRGVSTFDESTSRQRSSSDPKEADKPQIILPKPDMLAVNTGRSGNTTPAKSEETLEAKTDNSQGVRIKGASNPPVPPRALSTFSSSGEESAGTPGSIRKATPSASPVKKLSATFLQQMEQGPVATVESSALGADLGLLAGAAKARSRAPSAAPKMEPMTPKSFASGKPKRDETDSNTSFEDLKKAGTSDSGAATPNRALTAELAQRLNKVLVNRDDDEDGTPEETEDPAKIAALEPANINDIKKDGLLGRRNDESVLSLRAWKNVWAELAGGCLYFYKDPQNKKKIDKRDKPNSIIDVRSCRIDISGQYDKKKIVFAIMTMKGEFLQFQAQSEADMTSWCDVILEQPGVRKENLLADSAQTSRKSSTDVIKRAPKKSVSEKTSPMKKMSVVQTVNEDDLNEEERRERAKTKLFGFFKNRPTPQNLKERGLIPQDMIFGGVLELQLLKEKRKIPAIVEQCIKKVEEKDTTTVGIYRLSGNASHIQKLRILYNEDQTLVDLSREEWSDINVVTGTLKLYFRELQNPLLTFERYDALIAAAKLEELSARQAAVKDIITKLPKPNYDTLQYVIRHLEKISKLSDENKMDAGNLAVVFGPTLLRPLVDGLETILNVGTQNSIIEMMILNTNFFFGK